MNYDEGDIVSKIKDRQHNFFTKVSMLSEDDAIAKTVINICNGTDIIRY